MIRRSRRPTKVDYGFPVRRRPLPPEAIVARLLLVGLFGLGVLVAAGVVR